MKRSAPAADQQSVDGIVVNGARVGLTDGWISAKIDDAVSVHIRVGLGTDDELRITDVMVSAPEVTSDILRQLHPSRILAAVSEAELTATEADGHVVPVMQGRGILRRLTHADPQEWDDKDLNMGRLRKRADARLSPAKRPLLGRPANYPDGFYQRVADAYRSAASESGKPAVLLSDENGVPVETVRRWVKEARRQGLLERGRKGRAL